MKKKLVLMLTLGLSMVPSVLFAAYGGATGEGGGRLGAICQGTTSTYAQKDNGSQDLSSTIRPLQDNGGVTSAMDTGSAKGGYVH